MSLRQKLGSRFLIQTTELLSKSRARNDTWSESLSMSSRLGRVGPGVASTVGVGTEFRGSSPRGGPMGGIVGLGASFSFLKVRDILGPQFGVGAWGILCSHESWEARDMQCTEPWVRSILRCSNRGPTIFWKVSVLWEPMLTV